MCAHVLVVLYITLTTGQEAFVAHHTPLSPCYLSLITQSRMLLKELKAVVMSLEKTALNGFEALILSCQLSL